MLTIGIAGASASGKTTFAAEILAAKINDYIDIPLNSKQPNRSTQQTSEFR